MYSNPAPQQTKNKKKPSEIIDFRGLLVRVVRLERTVSWSQTRRDTNFAIPGYSISAIIPRRREKIKDFSVCGHLCGQSRFYAVFSNGGNPANAGVPRLCGVSLAPSRIPPRHSQSRRATSCATPGCSVGIIIPHVEIARKYLLKVFNKLLTVEFCGISSKFFRPYN